MARRENAPSQIDARQPRYEWAFDGQGRPIAIEHAERGQEYLCPLCGGKMIPRLGEIKQYHYAHEEETDCPPVTVAERAAARWIGQRLEHCLSRQQVVWITWPCRLCDMPHTIDLLDGVTRVAEQHTWDKWTSDLALLDADGAPRAVIALGAPEPDALRACAANEITALSVPPTHLRSRTFSLPQLLKGAMIHGGICLTQTSITRQGIITDVDGLRDALAAAALRDPFYAYGALETQGNITHILTLREQHLWLPLGQWQRAIGGVLHAISPAVQVITQEWSQPDGATVALYYVTVKDASAVAVRRFGPGEPVHAHLANVSLRSPRTAALEIARGFARA